jgi:uncharacterized protein YodC (DUF2158 family)
MSPQATRTYYGALAISRFGIAIMEVGAKVRHKTRGGPLMTVVRKTEQGYLVCEWHEPRHTRQERMFFPETLMEETSSPGPTAEEILD